MKEYKCSSVNLIKDRVKNKYSILDFPLHSLTMITQCGLVF